MLKFFLYFCRENMKSKCVIIIWFVCHNMFAQNITVDGYINIYKELAVSEMQRSGIPASIKLAQGILESANGNSRLAVSANNHFGIKCHGWTGEEIYHDDDEKNECFRKYREAKESYYDHTNFLMRNSRYAFLFEYKSDDYKSWARGLSRAGYATDPNYAQKLINLIERYSLQQYDKGVIVDRTRPAPSATDPQQRADAWEDFASFHINRYQVKSNNRTEYIVTLEGDSYTSLSNEFDMMPWQLPRYNDAKSTDQLQEGQVVYLQPKRRKAERGKVTHTVKADETMRSISQQYAVKLPRLYVLNRMEDGTQPNVGDVLNLRKKKKK